MIDFSLSRVCKGMYLVNVILSINGFQWSLYEIYAELTGGDIFYKDLRDEGYFNGEGDYQFDIYRLMRVHNG